MHTQDPENASLRGGPSDGLEHFLADELDVEARELLETFRTADNQEGVRAFAEKRAPRFTGR